MRRISKTIIPMLMLIMLTTTAFATNPTSQETPVKYTGIGTQTYEVTVPSLLHPGDTGEVKLEGTWDSTKTMKVDTNESIIMTNSIDQSTKEIQIEFSNISQIGSNITPIEITESIKIGEITDALFGTWNGNIIFNISVDNSQPTTYDATFANNTWQQIAEACQTNAVPATWNVGDIKTMQIDSVEYEVVIIGKNHDTYADGSGTAPLTFQLVNVLSTAYTMNSTNTNAGGWDGSALYTTLNTTILNTLEADVKDNIKAVSKATNLGGADPTAIRTTSDKLFLLSPTEVFDYSSNTNVYKDEGTQYEYYATKANRIKTTTASVAYVWWLRSPNYNSSVYFNIVDTSGSYGISYASIARGISFGFCF